MEFARWWYVSAIWCARWWYVSVVWWNCYTMIVLGTRPMCEEELLSLSHIGRRKCWWIDGTLDGFLDGPGGTKDGFLSCSIGLTETLPSCDPFKMPVRGHRVCFCPLNFKCFYDLLVNNLIAHLFAIKYNCLSRSVTAFTAQRLDFFYPKKRNFFLIFNILFLLRVNWFKIIFGLIGYVFHWSKINNGHGPMNYRMTHLRFEIRSILF